MRGTKIRKAKVSDYSAILEYDEFPGDRRIDIERGELLIADCGLDQAVGYLRVTSNEFFNKPLIAIVNTDPDFRSIGIASRIDSRQLSAENISAIIHLSP